MLAQCCVLARYPDFRRLFAGSTVSQLGSNVTAVALPLTAVVYLHASPIQMGVLGAAGLMPHLVLGLPAGVWVSRLPYRRLLVATDLAQMLLLGAIPVLATVHALGMWQLYLIVITTLGALAGQIQAVIVVLFLVRDLHLSSALIGVAFAISGMAGITGALFGVPVTERIGNGPAFIAGQFLAGIAGLVLACAGGPYAVVLPVLLAAQLLRGWGPALYKINQRTIRQVFIAPEMMSRAQATWRFLVFGSQPIGALLGGLLANAAGYRATLVIGSVLILTATLIASASPLRNLRRLSEEPAAA